MARPLAASAPRVARGHAWPASGVLRPLAGAAGMARSGASFIRRHRRPRNALVAVLAALPLLGGGWWWLRDSPLVAVERVQIAGVSGPDAASVEAALSGAARRMSTLDVNVGALRAAVAPFRVVEGLSVSASFPHALHIRVVEQLPVAALSVGGVRTAVAADGVVLGPALLSGSLPAIAATGSLPPGAGHVEDATVRAELRVLGAAPRVLLGWVARVFMDGPPAREGLTVAMRDGLTIYFGDATRPHAKWDSAVRVLADPSSAGATYVDVRAPERPAAGTASAGGLEGSATPAQVSASDPTAAALASVLAEAVNGGSGAATTAASATGPTAAGSVAATPGAAASGAAQSEPSAVAPSGSTAQAPQSATGAGGSAAPSGTATSATEEPSASTSG
jgi:cell division protein FtsQ